MVEKQRKQKINILISIVITLASIILYSGYKIGFIETPGASILLICSLVPLRIGFLGIAGIPFFDSPSENIYTFLASLFSTIIPIVLAFLMVPAMFD